MNSAPDPSSQLIMVRIKEACRITGIGRSKLYELIADGEVEIIKIGAMTMIPIDALSRFIERRRARSNRH